MVLDEDFKEFIQLLNANNVKYLVIGGFAVAYHGYPRYTKDIDFEVCFERCMEAEFEGVPIHFIGLEDLVKNKLSTGRFKDKVDAQTLIKKNKKNKK